MNNFIFIVLTFFLSISLFAQEKISFKSADNLDITADLYVSNDTNQYILFFHQANYSRGEYKDIAKKISKLGYNCLAVDLRSGYEANYITNETAKLAASKGLSQNYIDSKQDIESAIDYIVSKTNKQVILFGSSYSASLSLLIAKDNPKVKAVVGFSPGEFFQPSVDLKQALYGFNKPVFIASSQREYPYVYELDSSIISKRKTFFKPQNGPGEHGAKALWKTSDTNREYWLALMIFLQQI